MRRFIYFVVLSLLVLGGCDSSTEQAVNDGITQQANNEAPPAQSERLPETPEQDSNEQADQLMRSALVGSLFEQSAAPAAIAYKEDVQDILVSELPILALTDLADPKAVVAQKLVLDDPLLKRALFEKTSSKPLRNEVMSVRPALPGDRVGAAKECGLGQCYRIDIYNFFHNVTITVIADVINNKVLTTSSLPETQPDLSPRLEQLAEAIAKHEPLVKAEIARYLEGTGSSEQDPLPVMVSTKSALKYTLCERSKHLCVAPTYVLGSQALWVIVDLTDFKVAGVRWTAVGDQGSAGAPQIITERKLENEYVYKNFCEKVTELKRNGWALDYNLTSSDGLRLANVRFADKAVFDSAKVVDWHVSYSTSDGFGYSDATGCPMFSSAVVVAFEAPAIEPIIEDGTEIGFSLTQDFRQLPWPAACNYRYQERYEFYNDGRYRVALSNHGRGCGINGTYRPVLRMQFGAPGAANGYAAEQWAKGEWLPIEQEQWSKQVPKPFLNEQQYSHRLINQAGAGYLLAPSTGDFNDGGRGDNAFIYTTVQHADRDEGASDLVTLGSCCNQDHRQGPEQFMQPPESTKDQALVLWYVPQIENDATPGEQYCWAEKQVVDGVLDIKTWPCTGGPFFIPTDTAVNKTVAEGAVSSE